MELVDIEKLLERYFNTETTLKEEQILQTYFCSGKVASHLEKYSSMFNYFKQSKNETLAKTIHLKSKDTNQQNLKWFSIAVSIALLLSVYMGFDEYQKHQKRKQFEQIKASLQIFTSNLNKGNEALFEVSYNINKAKEAVKYIRADKKSMN